MTSTHTATVPADPDVVFGAITDIDQLPDWNRAITAVVHRPDSLVEGTEWVVELRALGQRWLSRSTLTRIDPRTRRVGYCSRTDDGNPSWTRWEWSVDDHPAGAEVTVTFDLHPVTFWRRVLLSHIRSRQLARTEVPASLTALCEHLTTRSPSR